MIKQLVKNFLHKRGYALTRIPDLPEFARNIPDAEFYAPLFSPWLGYGDFARHFRVASQHSLVSADRCYVLYALALQAMHLEGEFWECGVYRGGSAHLLAEVMSSTSQTPPPLRLFDTFAGMPATDAARDFHSKGDFSDTGVAEVQKRVGPRAFVHYHEGRIPETFMGLESSKIALAHIDVDIYQSVIDSIAFIMPRLARGGIVIFDDYGFPTCPGARQAVDEFFADRREQPLVLHTGQAVVFKSFEDLRTTARHAAVQS